MAVDATSPLKVHNFTGAGTYGVTFRVLETNHIQVQLLRADGTVVGLVNGVDYSVTILPDGAGANIVVTTTTYSSGGTIEIRRIVPVTQVTSWANGGALDMPLLTLVFDKMTMVMQQFDIALSEALASAPRWLGVWTGATGYWVRDIVADPVTLDWYVCIVDHTSSAWATDKAASKWALILPIQEVLNVATAAVSLPPVAAGDEGKVLLVDTPYSGGYVLGTRNDERHENYIIDGDFHCWYEGTTQTTDGYGSDSMCFNGSLNTTKVHERVVLNPADVANADHFPIKTNVSKTTVTSVAGATNYCIKVWRVPFVHKFSGKDVTFSFHLHENNKPIAVEFFQNFGTGGSPSAEVTSIGSQLIAAQSVWRKEAVTAAIPSAMAKVLGTNGNDYLGVRLWFDAGSSYNAQSASLGQQSGVFQVARARLVIGDTDGDALDLDEFECRAAVAAHLTVVGTSDYGDQLCFTGNVTSGSAYMAQHSFKRRMRKVPSITAAVHGSVSSFPNTVGTLNVTELGVQEQRTANATAYGFWNTTFKADARL